MIRDSKMTYDCFLSYASPDLAHGEAIHERLNDAGFKIWFDKARLQPGYSWHKEIEVGCENSRIVLPLLTPRWKQSEWTRYETYGAEAVIPLLVEGAWPEVSTPPLTRFQNFCVPLASASEPEWQRLFDSIREFCTHEAPQKEERVNRLRYHPARYFVGRENELNEIHERLFVNPTAALTQGHVQAVTALGGVGKTTLARQYAEKFWRCYRQMFWVDCRLGLETEFAAIHDILRPDPEYAALSSKDKAGWVRVEFSQSANRPRRLLILDNAEDEESVLAWIPKTGSCHVLITSRFMGWSSGIETYRVWVLDPGPARELLLRRFGRSETPVERQVCDTLAKKLEYLPLALEQAAAYVAAQPPGWGFAEYLRLYEANEHAFLIEKTPGATEYPHSVHLTWRATIDKLPQGARAILRLHAFLASTPTPAGMFVRGADRIAEEGKMIAAETGMPADEDIEGAGEFSVRKWISSLAKYSMVQLQPEDSFSVHGLVHEVEWHAMGERRSDVLERTTGLFISYAERPSWEPESRRMWDVLLPHAARLVEQKLGLSQQVILLDCIKDVYDERGDFRHAIPAQRQRLLLQELELGPEHPDTLTSVNNLARLLRLNGEYEAAEALNRRVLQARERILGPDHPDTLVSINNVAVGLYYKGEYAAAEPLYQRVLEARERLQGPEDPATLGIANNLAALLQGKGDLGAAELLYQRILEARQRVLGPEHPHTLMSLNDLAALLHRKRDYAAAEPLYQRILEAKERVLGPEHPDTLLSVNNLAVLLYDKRDFKAAEPLYRRALETRERVLGPEHPETLQSVNSVGRLLCTKGEHAAAELFYRRALETRERVLGPGHPNTLSTLENLIDLLAETSRPDESTALRKEYFARTAAAQVSAPPLARRQLALECYRGGDYSRAEQLLGHVLKEGFELSSTHCHLARVLLLMDRDKEALAEVNLAWKHRTEGPSYMPQRIHFLQVLFGMLDGVAPTEALQDLKRELLRPDAMQEWDLKRLLDHLKPCLIPKDYELLEALSAAINDRVAMKQTLPAWNVIL
jgi:tetratricopeptide (TPR) repeat protein